MAENLKPDTRNKAKGPADRDARLQEVARLYLKGRYQSEIATELGVSQQQVSYDLKSIQKLWRESAVRDFDSHQSEELKKIDHLERTYWDGWSRSLEKFRKTVQEASIPKRPRAVKDGEPPADDDGKPRPTKATVTEEERDGNPAFLAGVERCIERRCVLLDLNPAEKKQLSGPGGGAIPVSIVEAAEKVYGG